PSLWYRELSVARSEPGWRRSGCEPLADPPAARLIAPGVRTTNSRSWLPAGRVLQAEEKPGREHCFPRRAAWLVLSRSAQLPRALRGLIRAPPAVDQADLPLNGRRMVESDIASGMDPDPCTRR